MVDAGDPPAVDGYLIVDDVSAGPSGVPGYGSVEAEFPKCPTPMGLYGVLDLRDEDGVGTPASLGVPIPE
jgi:hypothetical protein